MVERDSTKPMKVSRREFLRTAGLTWAAGSFGDIIDLTNKAVAQEPDPSKEENKCPEIPEFVYVVRTESIGQKQSHVLYLLTPEGEDLNRDEADQIADVIKTAHPESDFNVGNLATSIKHGGMSVDSPNNPQAVYFHEDRIGSFLKDPDREIIELSFQHFQDLFEGKACAVEAAEQNIHTPIELDAEKETEENPNTQPSSKEIPNSDGTIFSEKSSNPPIDNESPPIQSSSNDRAIRDLRFGLYGLGGTLLLYATIRLNKFFGRFRRYSPLAEGLRPSQELRDIPPELRPRILDELMSTKTPKERKRILRELENLEPGKTLDDLFPPVKVTGGGNEDSWGHKKYKVRDSNHRIVASFHTQNEAHRHVVEKAAKFPIPGWETPGEQVSDKEWVYNHPLVEEHIIDAKEISVIGDV